jgi:L-Lysine epsilon oxidase N-terminal/L-lysine epsilon oxidase C-terminal domain
MAITRIRIFPSIGIARIGNAETEFFIGPEIPGKHERPDGGYKDATCRIKRQAARFRLYAYDENDQLIFENGKPKEITAADGEITWKVQLANTKGSSQRFHPIDSTERRNKGIDAPLLEITPTPHSLTGANHAPVKFDDGSFLGTVVYLGEASTDSDGRLIVLGGLGQSGWVGKGPMTDIQQGYDHDGWYDDVSDGPIDAQVVIGGAKFESAADNLTPAWVIVGPPKFVPSVDPIVTLYDVLAQRAGMPIPAPLSFNLYVYSILRRALDLLRLTSTASGGHTTFPLSALPGDKTLRGNVLSRVRNPDNPNDPNEPQADMPRQLETDEAAADKSKGQLAITPRQYKILATWANGTPGTDWIDDWTGAPPQPATEIWPDELTRAALEACVGGGLRPGIEAGCELRDSFAFVEPFRLSHAGRRAGEVTRRMAVPWQSDFYQCKLEAWAKPDGFFVWSAWWPTHRPDDVFRDDTGAFVNWTSGDDYPVIYTARDMLASWSKLGFVVENESGELVETERRPVCRTISFFADTIAFSRGEVATALQVAPTAV